jgi:hypothetical protein
MSEATLATAPSDPGVLPDAVTNSDIENTLESNAGLDPSVYLRRRRIASLIAWVACPAILLVVFTSVGNDEGTAAPSITTEAAQDPIVSSGSLPSVEAALDAAEAHHADTGSFHGFSTGLLSATGHDIVFVADGSEGLCAVAAIVQGHRRPAVFDQSGEGCDPAVMAGVQAELLRTDGARSAETDRDASELLARGAAAASRAAQGNFVDDRPSFLGIDAVPIAGIALVPTGDDTSVKVRTTLGPCWELTVTASGHTSTPSRC